jgi:hypothetical protein
VDATTILNFVSLAISLGAASTAVWAALRQARVAHAANQLPVVIELFTEPLTAEWQAAERYVLDDLKDEHDPNAGIDTLPVDVLHSVYQVCLYYDNIGKLVAHRIVEEDLAIGSWGGGASRAWNALGPFIYADRRIRDNRTMAYFEDFAWRSRRTSPQQVHDELGLKRLPP